MTEASEAAALVSKEEAVSSDPPEPTKAKKMLSSSSGSTEDSAASAGDNEKSAEKAKEASSTSNTTARARSTTASGASSVPPIIPQRSILRKPSREYQQPEDVAGGMAARKRYYDYPPPPQHGAYHPFARAPYASHPPPFQPFGYSSGRHPHAHHAYSQHASAAAAEHYQYHQQYAAAAAAAAAAHHREGQSPRIAMGPGRGPPPPWLGGPGGTVSPLRPPPPRASFKPETYGRVGRRLALAEEADDNDTSVKSTTTATASTNGEGEGEGQGPNGNRSQSMRDSKYDDALLLAEVSKIAETEAHHRKEAEAEANSSSGGSAASTDGDAAGGIQQQQADPQEQGETPPTSNKSMNDDDARETTTSKKQEEDDEAPSHSLSSGDNNSKEDIESARHRFSDQAKRGSLASPVVLSIKATARSSNDREAGTDKEEGNQDGSKKQDRSPPPMELSHPPASQQQGHGRRYTPNYEEQYAEYYYPPATYPMPHMSLRMQAGRVHHRRGHSGEIFYSPGGPYPISAGGRHPFAAYRHRPEYEEGGPSDGVIGSDRQERLSRPPPEYTPPSAYFNRHAPRQLSKHVEVTPNSHEESPLSRSKRPHVETQEGDAANEGGPGGSPEPGAVRSTQRRARFDESTERDQEDRDRRRAAAAAEAAAKGSGGSKASAIPPFPSPRLGASVSAAADEKASGSQTKPYLPPPRPTTGSRFPYQDDESRLAGEYVPTVTPRGEETSKPMHTFSTARPAPTPPPQEQQAEGTGWSPYPLNQHRRIPSGGFEFTIRPRDFGASGGLEPSIVSTWGKSASWDNEEDITDQGTPPTPSTPSKILRTPRKGHRKSLPSVSMDYSDSPPGNVVFTPRSSFDPMAESHRFLPPTPGGFFSDPAEYLDYGDYQYAESSVPPSAYASSAALPPPQMMLPRRQQAPHQQGAPFHQGSPQALAPRQFATPSNSGGSKYPPLSAFQADGTPGGYYGGYAGKTIIRRKCPWKNFPEVRTSSK